MTEQGESDPNTSEDKKPKRNILGRIAVTGSAALFVVDAGFVFSLLGASGTPVQPPLERPLSEFGIALPLLAAASAVGYLFQEMRSPLQQWFIETANYMCYGLFICGIGLLFDGIGESLDYLAPHAGNLFRWSVTACILVIFVLLFCGGIAQRQAGQKFKAADNAKTPEGGTDGIRHD